MKINKIDFERDFIGGLGSLTKIEENSRKLSAKKTVRGHSEITTRPNILA